MKSLCDVQWIKQHRNKSFLYMMLADNVFLKSGNSKTEPKSEFISEMVLKYIEEKALWET